MTDEKKGPDQKKGPEDPGEVDWDSALSDWGNNFVPEVAKDVVTDKRAGLSGGSVSRPLYRPPQVPPPKAKGPPPPPARPIPSIAAFLDDDEEDGATVISNVPREILRRDGPAPLPAAGTRPKGAPPPRPTPGTRGGGLGQFFARDDKREGGGHDEPSKSAARPRSQLQGAPVTSPPPASPRADHSGVSSLRRPAGEEFDDIIHEEGFDPFGEARAQQLTIPAESEISDLLGEPAIERGATQRPSQAPSTRLPSIHVPSERQYDPDDVTVTGRTDELLAGVLMPPPAAERPRTPPPPAAERPRTPPPPAAERPRTPPPPAEGPRTPPPPPLPWAVPAAAQPEPDPGHREATPARSWENERPASEWLDETARVGQRSRAAWLEEEARAVGDGAARGRALLACSEILAGLGDHDRAESLAREARDLGPTIALAHRQVRGLMPSLVETGALLEAIDAEVERTPSGIARTHALLLAADAAAADGDDEESGKRLDQAARIAPTEVRAAVARAARALREGDLTAAKALRFPDAGELAPVGEALRFCLRLRGARQAEADRAAPSPNEILMRARAALDKGDLAAAAPLVAELARVPELARGALWLAAALGAPRGDSRPKTTAWLRELMAQGEEQASRPLAARALEVSDAALMAQSLAGPGPLKPAERLVLATLAGLGEAAEEHLEATAESAELIPLTSAAAALSMPAADDPRRDARLLTRTLRAAGSVESRALVGLGRLLGAAAAPSAIEAMLGSLGTASPAAARAVALEMAARGGRVSEVSATLEAWGAARGSAEDRASGALAAAIVAERAGDRARALQGFKAARAADPTSEAALRAVASLEPVDLVAEMNALADELGEGIRAGVARLEAVTLGERVLPEPTQAHLLERAHRSAPALPIAAFLAERLARRAGDVEEVLQWIRDRRAQAVDPADASLDAVREALLVADREPALAAERLREAHLVRPGDVALRELYERMAAEPPDDRAAWRENRAAEATGAARVLLLLEAARENERAGDEEGALRCAEAAATGDSPLASVVRERAELRTGRVARLADELFSAAKSVEEPTLRREAFERLANLDLVARRDPASALLWHRSIFEEQPEYKPSLRYLEQHLVTEGRDDELEPVASAIANALRETGSPECTAHAELAARLLMRGAAGSWEATRGIVEVAAAESEPSLWALRMLQSHSRARGDDAGFLAVTRRLVNRASRPVEVATLLVRAAEAAARLEDPAGARALLERASVEDPGDVVTWELLVQSRMAAGDVRGAADASESLARSSVVADRQLAAWYQAGRIWQDDAKDEDRALAALEAAAAIDVAHEDVFDRLSRIYASRKMQPELAQLLERRMDCVTDPDERLAIEVRRGRVLFEAGDVAGARAAYESALAERPDDAQALAAFTDLSLAQGEWEVAEQSLIRLARLLPTPDEQRIVYGQLGELYSHHLLNLSRAEVALKEVLKCAPDDVETTTKLVDVYKRQNDSARAVELQQELVQRSTTPEEKRARVVELALIHEEIAHDNRKAEQALESARREFPQDVTLLRALAEFYTRHRQTPAFNILLDRAGADARRALTAGRLTPASFEVLAAVFDLRGKGDAARASRAMLATLEGEPVELQGAGVEGAFDPALDDLLAPEALSAPLRGLLAKTGDALDAVTPVDLRALKASPIAADSPVVRLVMKAAAAAGIRNLNLLVSPKLGTVCLPVGSSPPAIVMGESLLSDERIGSFLALRALKLVRVNASALGRTVPGELGVLVSAWLKCFNPEWMPQGINAAALTTAIGRIQGALPRNLAPDVGVIALEVAATIGTRQATLGPAALAWANRVAMLALGDPNAALDAIASAGAPGAVGIAGPPKAAPRDPKERAAWVARTPEARDLVAFGATEAFAEARARLGLDR